MTEGSQGLFSNFYGSHLQASLEVQEKTILLSFYRQFHDNEISSSSTENPNTIYPDGYRGWIINIHLLVDANEWM
jgi:hypothetical protein